MIAAATMCVGFTDSGSTPVATMAIAKPVASAPPTICWKKNGSDRLFSSLPTRSMTAVIMAANRARSASPPMRSEIAAAMPA